MSSKDDQSKTKWRPKGNKPFVKYRCSIGREWKTLDCFPNGQHYLIRRRDGTQGYVDRAKTGMMCFEHYAEPAKDMKCEACQLERPFAMFSRNQRKAMEPHCRNCVDFLRDPLSGDISTYNPVADANLEVWGDRPEKPRDMRMGERIPSALAFLGLEHTYESGMPNGELMDIISSASFPSPLLASMVTNIVEEQFEADYLSACDMAAEWGFDAPVRKTIPTRNRPWTAGTRGSSNETISAGGEREAVTAKKGPRTRKGGWSKAPREQRQPPEKPAHMSMPNIDPNIDRQRYDQSRGLW